MRSVRLPRPGSSRDPGAQQPTPGASATGERGRFEENDTPREREVAAAVAAWRARLTDLVGGSALWDVYALGDAMVELTAAHPSGIAQLYAGRSTPLSNLVREGSALTQARRRARIVVARTEELAQRFGVAPTYVAMGVATWESTTAGDPAGADAAPLEEGDGSEDYGNGEDSDLSDPGTVPAVRPLTAEPEDIVPRTVHAPVLLRPVRVRVHGSDAEIDLEIDPAVELNSLLVRDLRARGVEVDAGQIARSTMTPHGFSPRPALEHIAELGQILPGFRLEPRIVVGAFVHPGQALADDLDAQERELATHDVVAALAGVDGARMAVAGDPPAPDPDDRDPDEEAGVGDLDPGQQDVLDAVTAGGHLLVDTPPGTDSAATMAAVVAQAAADGRRVLYVPGTRRAGQALLDALRRAGVADLALDLSNDPRWPSTASSRLVEGLNPPEPEIDTEARAAERARLRQAREALREHLDALHRPRLPWQASAYDALQALAELTSQRPGPRTQVRVASHAVRSMSEQDRQHAREELARAAALGAFRLRAADTPWFGARLTSADHATATLERVRELGELMPDLRAQIARTAVQTGLDEATTLEQWSEQLLLLDGIRSSLDVFTPQVFERSAADMVAATGTRAWRAQHDIDMGWGTRRRLKKQARDLLRPGGSVGDLHAELIDVQERRDLWRRHCAGGGWPRLPEGMSEIARTEARVAGLASELDPVLAGTLGGREMAEVPLEELATRLARLGADDVALRQLPERAAVLAHLGGLGLDDLLADLTHRRVPTSLVGAEFDLAWWSSVLEEILGDDPSLAGLETSVLEEAAATLRESDRAQTASLTAQVLARVREHVRASIAADRARAQEFYRAVRGGGTDLKDLLEEYGQVVWAPRPVWIVPPMVVPQVLPPERTVDLVVLDAVQHVPAEQVISSIARATQVVVVGDTRRGSEGGVVSQLSWLPTLTLHPGRGRQAPDVAAFLSAHGYDETVQPLPTPPGERSVRLELVDGTGMPVPGADVVESVQAEVDRVVDLVIDHALSRPEESLAVVALNTRHADRVREAVLSVAAGSASMSAYFDQSRTEAFTVVDVESAAGLRRDAIVLTLGFGKTPHGRVLHRFGAISGPDGVAYLTDALDAVRHRLTLVSCLGPEDLDPERVRAPGSQMLLDLLHMAAAGQAQRPQEDPGLGVDRLLLDLAERLWRRGLTVVPRYGIPGGIRIPLAVGHPALPDDLLLAVRTDDEDYMAEPSLRRRDRHWVERLVDRGWHVRTVYSSAVFMDPQGEAEKIAAQLDLIVAERTGIPPEERPALPQRWEDETSDLADGPGSAVTSARGVAMVGASLAGSAAGPADRDAGMRTDRPDVPAGQPLSRYGDDELDALVAWIASDGLGRTVEELRDELRRELGIAKRGTHVDAVLAAAARRSGLAEPASAPGITETTEVTEATEVTESPAEAEESERPVADDDERGERG
ncbi:hypothetical protein LQF12_03195 [Ruania suaedae]|uniref:hypothetical protein n=1 Tax=Ruania suaedae TaxID=2897774 RepID=UPI001E5EB2B2|nr:hypothetical protein [Ruania suaedae]UFU03630.1 hypothetical protein LQF12_03195 [Ruania suaedae]